MSDMSYGQLRAALQAAIAATLHDDDAYCYVEDFSDSWVIYYMDGQDWQHSYSVGTDDGVITLAGDPTAVQAVVSWSPVAKNAAVAYETAGAVLAARHAAPARVRAEPLTYHRGSRHSYYRDLLRTDRTPGARERQERHLREMDALAREWETAAWRSFRAAESRDGVRVEYRVEPGRTPGFGGNFAPPAWLNQFFARANRPGRVLSGLIPSFPLPPDVQSVNVPVLTTGTIAQAIADATATPEQDITDTPGSSCVVSFAGDVDVPFEMLDQSPLGASLDWAITLDLCAAYDANLEYQLIAGLGASSQQLVGATVATPATTATTYTSGTPAGTAMWTVFGQAAAQIGDARQMPPECWLMRTARWAWINAQEDANNRPLGIGGPFFLGSDPNTPDPIGGILNFPTFLDDAIPATLGASANQDEVVGLRPTDMILFEGSPRVAVMRDPGSGSRTARIQLVNYTAAVTNRHAAGIATVGGTGFAVQSKF